MAVVPTSVISEPIFQMTRTLTVIFIIGFIAMVVAVFIFTRMKVIKPLNIIKDNLKDVSSGKLNVNIARAKFSGDEIGQLANDTYALSSVIKHMVDDLSSIHHHVYELGDWSYTIDSTRYQNSFQRND